MFKVFYHKLNYYILNEIYEETDEYIIYNVEPVHSTVNRDAVYCFNIILMNIKE